MVELRTAVEAVLLVADEPVTARDVAEAAGASVAAVSEVLAALRAEYDERAAGWELRPLAGGWRLSTREDCADVVERFVRQGQQARLTAAALETLAVVAYRQPVTRARISAVRGVNVDGVVRSLLARGLLRETGTDPSSGATTYGTTPLLLERLGLSSLEELPSLAPLLPDVDSVVERAPLRGSAGRDAVGAGDGAGQGADEERESAEDRSGR